MIRSTPAIARADMIRCALCDRAPCDEACGKLNPAERLRNIWFGNEQTAAQSLPAENPCLTCKAPCEQACVRPGEVPVRDLINRLYYQVKPECETALPETEDRLKCDLCGIPLENPFLLSSSVVASTYDMCARAFEAGWAGICFKTICSLDIHEASPRFSAITGNDGSIIGFKNIEQLSDHSVAENMEIFRRLKEKYPTKFILASIMGRDEAEWGELARQCEENGADAVELNFSCPNMAEDGLGSDIGQVPELVERFTVAAKRACHIPVLAKLTPNVQSMGPAAEAARRGGAQPAHLCRGTVRTRAERGGRIQRQRRETHCPAVYCRTRAASRPEGHAPVGHGRRGNLAGRAGIHPAGRRIHSGNHGGNAVRLPDH